MLKIVSALLLALVLIVPATVQARDLSIATLLAPPIAFLDHGKPTGYGVEIVTEALRRAGFSSTTVIVPWKRGLFMTRNGELDGLFYTVRNTERLDWFHFPKEHLLIEATVMVKRREDVFAVGPDYLQYESRALGIGRGYYYGPKLKRFLEEGVFLRIEEANSIDLNFKKLLGGRIDMFLADADSAHHFLKTEDHKGKAEIVTDAAGNPLLFDAVKSYLAFSRKTVTEEEAQKFSEALSKMKRDGTYDAIIGKYQ